MGERRLFGTDGVRGVANVEPMTSETALRLGRALAYVSKRSPHRHKILIGKDGEPIAGIGSRTEPQAEEVRSAIETAL